MKEHKTIDRIFQEQFRDYEVSPPEKVWDNIHAEMRMKPARRQKFSRMWFAGIASGLVLLFVLNNPFNIISPSVPTTITLTPDENLPKNTTENTEITLQETNIIDPSSNKNSSKNTPKNLKPISSPITYTVKQSNKVALPNSDNSSLATSSSNSISKSQEDLTTFASVNTDQVSTKKHNKKWSVMTLAAPVILNSFSNTSSLDPLMDNLAKQSKISTSYGIQVAYKFSDKFSIQSGVHMVDFAYLTSDIPLYQNGIIASIANVNYDIKPETPDVSMRSTSQQPGVVREADIVENGNLTQIFGYIEIPLEAKYQLTGESDFGINVIGGFSTLLLNKNELLVETSNFSEKLGEASNLNSLNFSGNIGVEFEYNVYRNVNFNLVPMFKVQTQTIQNNNTFKPYSVGIYSGLNLRF